jgi:hypothetical protein
MYEDKQVEEEERKGERSSRAEAELYRPEHHL